eukprot:9487124-Pyramimonas_sp.AAC.1
MQRRSHGGPVSASGRYQQAQTHAHFAGWHLLTGGRIARPRRPLHPDIPREPRSAAAPAAPSTAAASAGTPAVVDPGRGAE